MICTHSWCLWLLPIFVNLVSCLLIYTFTFNLLRTIIFCLNSFLMFVITSYLCSFGVLLINLKLYIQFVKNYYILFEVLILWFSYTKECQQFEQGGHDTKAFINLVIFLLSNFLSLGIKMLWSTQETMGMTLFFVIFSFIDSQLVVSPFLFPKVLKLDILKCLMFTKIFLLHD